ncbi:MAG: hypothetical protein ACREDD_02530 [Methylocella sp.]
MPHDHSGIASEDGVIRRVSEKQVAADSTGQLRVSSKAFKPSTGPNGGMSVDLEKLVIEANQDPRAYVTTPRWTGSVRFLAGALREEGFMVGFDPRPENPYHGEVWGRFTMAQRRRLRELAVWFVAIPGVKL